MLTLAGQCRVGKQESACVQMGVQNGFVALYSCAEVWPHWQGRCLSGGSSYSPDVLEKKISLWYLSFFPLTFCLCLFCPVSPPTISPSSHFLSWCHPLQLDATSPPRLVVYSHWLMKSKLHGWTAHELKGFVVLYSCAEVWPHWQGRCLSGGSSYSPGVLEKGEGGG